MTFNFLGPGLTVNVEAKVKEQIILDSSVLIVYNRIGESPDVFALFLRDFSIAERLRR